MGEPIVETPDDALWCLLSSGLDVCILGDTIARKTPGFESLLELTPRIAAATWSLTQPILDRRFDLSVSARARLRFSAKTRWGTVEQEIAGPLVTAAVDLLMHLDGQATGWELQERLDPGEWSQRELETLLNFLRRLGLIELRSTHSRFPLG